MRQARGAQPNPKRSDPSPGTPWAERIGVRSLKARVTERPHDGNLMAEDDSAPTRCRALPRAARADYREDMLCASTACSNVLFFGVSMPVCRIHESMYARWCETADIRAIVSWGWFPALTTMPS